MVMCTLFAGFVWTTIRARLSLLDKNIGTSARFYAYVTDKSPTKMLCIFLIWGAYAPYANVMYCYRNSPPSIYRSVIDKLLSPSACRVPAA